MLPEFISQSYVYTSIFILVLLYIIYRFLISPYDMDQKYGFSGPKPVPLFGNLLNYLRRGFHVCDLEYQKKYGSIYQSYLGRTPVMVVADEAVLRQILVKDSKSFMDRQVFRGSSQIMKKNLLQLRGKDWERVRALVTPTFTSGKLKKMSPMIVASVQYMMERFDAQKNEDIDVKDIFGSLTMDVIAKTMFGIELDKSPSNSFVMHAKKLFQISITNSLFLLLIIVPSLASIVEWMYPRGINSPDSIEFFEKSLTKTIEMRKKLNEKSHDFLSLMMRAHEDMIQDQKDSDTNVQGVASKGLSEQEIMAQSIVFLLAGYETTASALTFCSYYLTMNQHTQEEVYKELVDNLPSDGIITYDTLSKLNLLECCLLEALRICPPASRFQRLCTSDTVITTSTGQALSIKKGMSFAIPVYAIHHNERFWPDPDRFDIHRFDSDEKQKRNQYTFLPFGAGPRTCVGMRFALLEAKLALAHMLLKYRLVACDKTPKELTFGLSGLTKVKDPVIIRIEER